MELEDGKNTENKIRRLRKKELMESKEYIKRALNSSLKKRSHRNMDSDKKKKLNIKLKAVKKGKKLKKKRS